jgi:hypothetical protein
VSAQQSQKHRKQEKARQQNEDERQMGLDSTDAASRFIADKEAGNVYRALGSPVAPWRSKPPTEAQRRLLRELGINPFTVTTRGEAADQIAATKNQKPRREEP